MTEERDRGDEQRERPEIPVAESIGVLFDVGKLWAAHGLNVGRSALHASAATLQATADLLGEISSRFATDTGADEATEGERGGEPA